MRLVWEEGGATLALGPEEPPLPQEAAADNRGGPVDLDTTVDTIGTDGEAGGAGAKAAFPNPVGAFRSDVRNAWVDAMFGPSMDFGAVHEAAEVAIAEAAMAADDDIRERPPQLEGEKGGKPQPPRVPAVEGAGLAGIKSFVAYGAVVPAGAAAAAEAAAAEAAAAAAASPAKSAASQQPAASPSSCVTVATAAEIFRGGAEDGGDGGTATAQSPPKPPQPPRLGIVVSRLPLGAYVRSVAASSEAHFSGILPGSILVDVNGLGVLGEPTHTLLERLWQYEDVASVVGGGGGADGGIGATRSGDEGWGGTSRQRSGKDPSTKKKDQQGGSASYCTYGGIGGPVALRFIRDGRLYTAVLLGGSPFGISWGPCGNFALVQRSYSYAEGAGVRRGCLVAAVNGRSLRDMDHVDVAEELRRLFAGGVSYKLVVEWEWLGLACRWCHVGFHWLRFRIHSFIYSHTKTHNYFMYVHRKRLL